LAIVEGIKIIENDDVIYPSLPWPYTLYSDSKIALSRVKKWKINTQITKNSTNALLFEKVEQAEEWLHHNKQRSEFVILKKRPTSQRGQIPADFGRK
jgi:ribonuclease HI